MLVDMPVVVLHFHRAVIAGFWQLQIRVEESSRIRHRRPVQFLFKRELLIINMPIHQTDFSN